jgi:hypothetical protein
MVGYMGNGWIHRLRDQCTARVLFWRRDHETFRDSVDMLAAADRYDSGTTQVLIARPDRSQTRIAGEAFGFWLAIVMGFKAPQTAGLKFKPGGQVHSLQGRAPTAISSDHCRCQSLVCMHIWCMQRARN